MSSELDVAIKLAVYGHAAATGKLPSSAEVAGVAGRSTDEVEAGFQRLHGQRLVVPEPGDPSRLRMAPPFSGIETPFPVEARGRRYYANCVWDALGVAAALQADAVIPARDGFTGEPIRLEVRDSRLLAADCVIHFAVPAAHWWDDIIHT